MHPYGRRHRTKRSGHRLVDLMLVLLLLGSSAYALWPTALDLVSSYNARQVISSMTSRVDATRDGERMQVLREAQSYNLGLGGPKAILDNAGLGGGNAGQRDILCLASQGLAPSASYSEQLCWRGSTTLCWVEVPSCSIAQPVYHGTAEETLAQGVGHLEGTSLPVGGMPSHCVLAAHSGMQNSRMFDDLETIREGDVFVVHTLGDSYWYQVFEVEVVTPELAEQRCALVEGEDLCTLVTCTPYGINSHRLLVHGRRVRVQANPPEQREGVRLLSKRRTLPAIACGTGGLLFGVTAFTRAIKRYGRQSRRHRRRRRYRR